MRHDYHRVKLCLGCLDFFNIGAPDPKQADDAVFLAPLGDRLDFDGRVAPFVLAKSDDLTTRVFVFAGQHNVADLKVGRHRDGFFSGH